MGELPNSRRGAFFNVLLERFNFDVCSAPAYLSFVDADNRAPAPLRSARRAVADVVATRTAALRSQVQNVFPHDECVICLGPCPDAVVVPCGHRCVHASCMREVVGRCPLCREPIAAFLPE